METLPLPQKVANTRSKVFGDRHSKRADVRIHFPKKDPLLPSIASSLPAPAWSGYGCKRAVRFAIMALGPQTRSSDRVRKAV
jgi:hypothetical protein